MKNVYCGNCGKQGHMFKECLEPITSLGLIMINNKNEYLMVCRKHSIGFVDLIRGKYTKTDEKFIQKLFNDMTYDEIEILKNNNFEKIWNDMWMKSKFNRSKIYYLDYIKAKNKFNDLNIELFIINKNNWYNTPEWGFPKGRREIKEDDKNAAIREFCEETGYNINEFVINSDIQYIEEYYSYNNIKYRHIYYLAYPLVNKELYINPNIYSQVSEISKVKWCSYNEAISLLRPRQIEKQKLLTKINDSIIKISNNIEISS